MLKKIPSPAALLVLTLALPRDLAIYLVPPLMFTLLWQGRDNIMRDSGMKLLLLLALVLPIFFSFSGRTVETARFAGIGLLIAIFPYHGTHLRFLREACLIVMGYVVIFQIGIMWENGPMIVFRETFYPIDDNRWEEAKVDQLYEGFRGVRAAGLFYNPNVMAQMVFFPYLISALLSKRPFSGSAHNVLALGSIFSIALSGSRTFLVTMILLLLLNAVKTQLVRGVTIFGLVVGGLEFIREFIFNDFSATGGSMAIKFSILYDYIALMGSSPENWARLVVGGTYDVHFDADIGYIIAAWGFVGLAVTAATMVLCCMRLHGSWLVIVPVYITSFSNTLFFSLLNAPFLVLVMLMLAARTESAKLPVAAKRERIPLTANGVKPRTHSRATVRDRGVRLSIAQE